MVRSGYEQSYLEALLDQYKALSDHIQVVKKDPDVNPSFIQQYTDTYYENSLIVESGDKYRYIDYGDIFVMDYEAYYYYGEQSWSFNGESEITSAIDYCLSDNLPKIYLLKGHGEMSLTGSFATAVEKANLETEELSLLTLEAVPDDADCLLILGPQRDISQEEATKIQDYLSRGGKVVYVSDPPQEGTSLTNLESIMAYYGLSAAEGIVVESNQNYYVWGCRTTCCRI